jgi:DNA-directed RNA polymerase subunit beta'
MGRLIPAGTGLSMYRKLGIKTVEDKIAPALENQDMDQNLVEKKLDIQAAN